MSLPRVRAQSRDLLPIPTSGWEWVWTPEQSHQDLYADGVTPGILGCGCQHAAQTADQPRVIQELLRERWDTNVFCSLL